MCWPLSVLSHTRTEFKTSLHHRYHSFHCYKKKKSITFTCIKNVMCLKKTKLHLWGTHGIIILALSENSERERNLLCFTPSVLKPLLTEIFFRDFLVQGRIKKCTYTADVHPTTNIHCIEQRRSTPHDLQIPKCKYPFIGRVSARETP